MDKTIKNAVNEAKEKKPKELEDPASDISEVFGAAPAKKTIHIIVQRPSAATG
ncbi:hypothetical protein BCR41DRAFT_402382 [Lobosporangium transversale]|uniref:Uncharacterized protein n=1 Tax=Lobosporangium transversale TaxID=64571 RepID=A0A1Y2G599_9FUNG|nr:hypothetical protein BCR41DRAFT_402382 [Lobosporangium transversale]ORY94348.1 hypothetical protein BCR41DRAFT_402382 [Lobosporangium transversale]|eukprot:XP_021875288.1 hypothetical protein BCR41DRAFT_402382 [Lobosporangium transversale]